MSTARRSPRRRSAPASAACGASLSPAARGVTIPQVHPPGEEAEVDFGTVSVYLDGELTELSMFLMRLSHSGRAAHICFAGEGQEAFLEGHVIAFRRLGGVPRRVRYDNLKAAVVRVLRGRDRVESDRFTALRSHYGFDAFYCEPGPGGAHEKGGVEGEVGRFRRRHLVPVPHVGSLAELNALLEAADRADDARHISGRLATVGQAAEAERPSLRPLPAEPFDSLSHLAYLGELLSAELEDREARRRERRTAEARFPRLKHLADFELAAAPTVDPALLAALERCEWVERGEPVVLLGDSGTGKSHLLIGLGLAACQRGLRVRYTTAAQLVNELAEASDERVLSRLVARYGRLDLLCLDELGYLQLDRRGAELLFQVLTEREERASVAVASNAPFSEWGQTFADPRLAAAVVDRLTFRAHIIETGSESYRLRVTSAPKGGASTT